MKKIIIYTTNDKIISLKLVNEIVTNSKYRDYEIDILLTKAKLLRKIKILIVILFFGSNKDFFYQITQRTSISQILKNNKKCKIVNEVKENYDYGLSVYYSNKIKIQNFKIYNFHLGSLRNQRGSFIFFYKYIKNWNSLFLTFHEITEKFDVGEVINERKILLKDNCLSSDIFFIYLKNLDFLNESISKINSNKRKNYEHFEKLNVVPSFFQLFKEIFKYFFTYKKNKFLK